MEELFAGTADVGRLVLQRFVDLRYEGQFHVLTIPLDGEDADEGTLRAAAARFHEEHARLYSFQRTEDPVDSSTYGSAW